MERLELSEGSQILAGNFFELSVIRKTMALYD